jgi:hypothetical protein
VDSDQRLGSGRSWDVSLGDLDGTTIWMLLLPTVSGVRWAVKCG